VYNNCDIPTNNHILHSILLFNYPHFNTANVQIGVKERHKVEETILRKRLPTNAANACCIEAKCTSDRDVSQHLFVSGEIILFCPNMHVLVGDTLYHVSLSTIIDLKSISQFADDSMDSAWNDNHRHSFSI
jgi:hypothetical protein